MEEEEEGMDNQEKLAGFIFMCNKMTKPECYRYRVFGLPAGRKHVVEKINPGSYLFLFDTDVKLLYGIYIATSSGKLRLEPLAFGQRFPAQVRFKIYKDCLPLPENCFKNAIQDNYQKDSNKFNPELNIRQVRSLLSLFRPLPVLSTAPRHHILKQPSSLSLPPANDVFHQISRPSLPEDAYLSRMSPNQVPWQFNYKHANELNEPPTSYSYPVGDMMPNSDAARSMPSQASRVQFHPPANQLTLEGTHAAGICGSFTRPMPGPHYTHQNILNPQPEFHSSLVNRGRGHVQSSQDPQHPHQSIQNPPPDFHSLAMNVGSSHAQLLQNPHYTNQNIPSLQPDSYSSMVNVGRNFAQALPDPQHIHQNTLNQQPDSNSSVVNMDHANVLMQSHASSSLDYPYTPQEVVSATYSNQWSGTGNEYYLHQSSMQTDKNISTQENAVSHNLYSADAYSQPVESHVQM